MTFHQSSTMGTTSGYIGIKTSHNGALIPFLYGNRSTERGHLGTNTIHVIFTGCSISGQDQQRGYVWPHPVTASIGADWWLSWYQCILRMEDPRMFKDFDGLTSIGPSWTTQPEGRENLATNQSRRHSLCREVTSPHPFGEFAWMLMMILQQVRVVLFSPYLWS